MPVTGFTTVSNSLVLLDLLILQFFFFFLPEGGAGMVLCASDSSSSELDSNSEDVTCFSWLVLTLFWDIRGAGNWVVPLGLKRKVSMLIPLPLKKAVSLVFPGFVTRFVKTKFKCFFSSENVFLNHCSFNMIVFILKCRVILSNHSCFKIYLSYTNISRYCEEPISLESAGLKDGGIQNRQKRIK